MTITKKYKKAILLNVYSQDRENLLKTLSLFEKRHSLTYVSAETYTNMYKRKMNEDGIFDENEDVFFYLDVTQNNSYLEIDNNERKIILHINEGEIDRFVTNIKRLVSFRAFDISEQNDIKQNNGINYGAILKMNIANKAYILFGWGRFTGTQIDRDIIKREIEHAKTSMLGDDKL